MTPYLASISQWIVVLLVPLANGKIDKIPVDYATGNPCSAHTPSVWTTYPNARTVAAGWGRQFTVGFVLTAQDDLFCLDIDGARQPDGSWSQLAMQFSAALPGCMSEVSLSGKGLHIWGRYPNPPPHRKKRIDLHAELYTDLRFIAIGTNQTGEIAPRCDALPALIAQVFPPVEASATAVPDDGPRADWRGPTDDDDLIRRALQSRSAASVFGTRATFADLWTGDVDALAAAFPSSDQSDPYDRSSADMALAAHLAFWTGCDVARIERLMRRSALVREKWDARNDYLVARTIMGQCARQRDVLQDKPVEPINDARPADAPVAAPAAPDAAPPPPRAIPGADVRLVEGTTFLSPAQQVEFFRGCIYVQDQHRVLVPSGALLKPDQFRARYGGYSFVMDNRNERTTRNAWEAFTESQAIRAPRADGVCFKPQLPFGAVIEVGDRMLANTYIKPNIKRKKGDASPFLRHLAKLVPDENERNVVFYTLCSLVQHAGYKAQWALVLQGVEGNGKTFLARCVARAVGLQYTYWPRADRIGSNFNSWLVGKVLYVLEELMVNGRQELMDVLKPLITSVEGVEVEKKGVDQIVEQICGNFLCNTNHKSAVLKTRNDRRWCVVQTAQQQVEDLARDGMDEAYHHALYDWANAGGWAIVADLLHSTPIPASHDFTKGLQRAPKTQSYEKVIADSRGPVEQEIIDAIEREDVGFRGGWVSSGFLDALLVRMGKDRYVHINRRREVMESLGYRWHPALPDGRVHNPVSPDGGKVKLFVQASRLDLLALQKPADVAAAYSAAQGVTLPLRA